jgi:hypothetical protein
MDHGLQFIYRQFQIARELCMLFVSIQFLSSLYPPSPLPLGLFFFYCIIHIYTMLHVHFTPYFWYQTCYQTLIRRKMTYIYSFMLQDVENIYTRQLWTITKIDKYWKRVSVFR